MMHSMWKKLSIAKKLSMDRTRLDLQIENIVSLY